MNQLNQTDQSQLNSQIIQKDAGAKKRKRAIIILALVVLILAGVLIIVKFTGLRQSAIFNIQVVPRSSQEIISELEGIQLAIQANYQINHQKYPIKTSPLKLIDLKSDVSQLVGYDDFRLKGANKKDFLYQSDANGQTYVIFATLPDGSKEIKSSPPTNFQMPKGYNFWLSSEKTKTK